eukprot:gene4755-5102_t
MKQLLTQYPESCLEEGFVTIPLVRDVKLMIKLDCSEAYAWDDHGTAYDSVLDEIRGEVLQTNTRNSQKDINHAILLIVQRFRDSFGKIAGFDCSEDDTEGNEILQNLPLYNPTKDPFWLQMKQRHKVYSERSLKIFTYGKRYIFQPPKGNEKIFDAEVIRGSADKKSLAWKTLIKLRGTSPQIQYEQREARLFESFVEEIIETIEKEDLHVIAIICKAGHHRSVAIAEMLKNLYINGITKHLTISEEALNEYLLLENDY